mmetsp:Transcript_4363/g.13201  ORF Transcript_4363/g.13201 Transcript_4363/m.13201 type:complete len:234 (-) Transcript_4363:1043-1744(-)
MRSLSETKRHAWRQRTFPPPVPLEPTVDVPYGELCLVGLQHLECLMGLCGYFRTPGEVGDEKLPKPQNGKGGVVSQVGAIGEVHDGKAATSLQLGNSLVRDLRTAREVEGVEILEPRQVEQGLVRQPQDTRQVDVLEQAAAAEIDARPVCKVPALRQVQNSKSGKGPQHPCTVVCDPAPGKHDPAQCFHRSKRLYRSIHESSAADKTHIAELWQLYQLLRAIIRQPHPLTQGQ